MLAIGWLFILFIIGVFLLKGVLWGLGTIQDNHYERAEKKEKENERNSKIDKMLKDYDEED